MLLLCAKRSRSLVAMLWIKEVEMVDSVDELKSSRSVACKNFPNSLDAKIASALNKIIQNSHFQNVSLEEQQVQKIGPVTTRNTDRLHDLRLLSSYWRSGYRSRFDARSRCAFSTKWSYNGVHESTVDKTSLQNHSWNSSVLAFPAIGK